MSMIEKVEAVRVYTRRRRNMCQTLAPVAVAAVLLVSVLPGAQATRTFVIQNNCSQTIWPALYEQGIDGAAAPSPQPMNGGWSLPSGQSTTLTLPEGFSGRFWARKDCTFNASGVGSCETGDCGGVLQCNGATGAAGTSLAEFTLWQPQNPTAFPQDWYDVSYVDGYDFPVSITPSNSTYEAPTCSFDELPVCPPAQQVKNAQGVVVECLSACTRFGNDPTVPTADQEIYCCAPPYNNSQLCNPSNFPNPPGDLDAPFKSACPNSYSWSDDDPTSVWHYNGDSSVSYTITFCPTSGYDTVVQTSGNGVYNGPTSTSGSWNSCSTVTIPAVPTGVTATGGTAQIALAWAASTGATSYSVFRGTTSGDEGTTPYQTGVVGTSYTDTAVSSGTTYYYTVDAANSAGTSGLSAEVRATPSTGVGVPSAPTSLTATGGSGQVALSWTASSGATSYNVYRGTTSGGEASTPIASAVTTASYTDVSVTNGTTYYYKVSAVNSAGTSGQSNEASATPSSGSGGGSTTTSTMIDCGGSATGSWAADSGYSGGTAIGVSNTINLSGAPYPVPTQALMQSERDGNVTYTITGLAPNSSHTVDLYFSENNFSASGQRQFNVTIQGSTVLSNFDVYANTGAEYKAIEQSFSTTASSSGQIVITFTTVKYNAEINGIAIQ